MVCRCRKLRASRACSLLLAVLVFLGSVTPVHATDGTATTSSTVGTSFYEVSTALTAFANTAVSLNSNDKHGDIMDGTVVDAEKSHKLWEIAKGDAKAGKGGCYIGYGDPNKKFMGSFQSNETNSVTVSGYDAYTTVGDGGAGYAYVRYGRLLADLGIDEVGLSANSGGDRAAGGKALQVAYLVASFIPSVFEIAFKILDALNPFRLLIGYGGHQTSGVAKDAYSHGGSVNGEAVTNPWNESDKGYGASHTGNESAPQIDGLTNGGTGFVAAMGPLINYVTDIYMLLRGIGLWVVMPMMTVLLLFTVFVMGQSKTWGALQKYAVRFVFIVLGIPFLGLTYTAVLDEFSAMSRNENRPSTRVIAATIVDFQNWVLGWRLDPPPGATLVSKGDEAGGSADGTSWRTVRETVYQINRSLPGNIYGLQSSSGLGLGTNGTNVATGAAGYDETFAGMFQTSGGGIGSDVAGQQQLWVDGVAEAGKSLTNRNAISGLLSTFSNGTMYSSSSWFSSVNGYMVANWAKEVGSKEGTASSTAIEKTIYQMYSDTDDADDWMNRQQDENKQIFQGGPDDATVQWVSKPWNIFSNGMDLGQTWVPAATVDPGTAYTFKRSAIDASLTNKTSSAVNPSEKVGLSTISMYNYLSTAFTASGVQVYSAEQSTSEFTKQGHYAANMAGTGATRVAFLVSCLVLLGIYVVLGLYYAVGMVISVLKHGFSMIMSIPAAMFGVMKSIVQVCAYVVQMITEILSSVWLYQVVMELVLVFATVVETPIRQALEDMTDLTASAVVGGIFGDASAFALVERLADCRPLFAVSLFALAALTVCLAVGMMSAGRAVLSVFTFVHYKVAYAITMDEFKPRFAEFVRTRESLDIWDDMKADGRRAIGAAGRALGAAGKEGVRI